MREKWQKQMHLMPQITDHEQCKELEVISSIIDANPTICELVLQDLNKGKIIAYRQGANGMSADQVLRCAIVKNLFGFTYQDLAFHIVDSQSLSWFCRIGIADKGFKKSALNKNIKSIRDSTWHRINTQLIDHAKQHKIEKGRKVRIDCTCVETNIHHPTDATLLWDSVRVLDRLIVRCRQSGIKVAGFQNHKRVAKRRMLAVLNAKRIDQRKAAYADLLKAAGKVLGYAKTAIGSLNRSSAMSFMTIALSYQLEHYVELTQKVIDQTKRRVMRGEKVEAGDKVVSIFEPHTDIIVKDRRDTIFGHKICLTGGASNLILDCWIVEGNPADVDLAIPMLDRQKKLYGRYPLKASFDGGFCSKDNLKLAKSRRIKDVCFAKKRGISETDMCRSHYVYRSLRRFRAGIESGISWLKRCLGLTRCTWKGWDSFKSYVWSSIVAANLLTMARFKTKPAT
jgi:IS5 family transposase